MTNETLVFSGDQLPWSRLIHFNASVSVTVVESYRKYCGESNFQWAIEAKQSADFVFNDLLFCHYNVNFLLLPSEFFSFSENKINEIE